MPFPVLKCALCWPQYRYRKQRWWPENGMRLSIRVLQTNIELANRGSGFRSNGTTLLSLGGDSQFPLNVTVTTTATYQKLGTVPNEHDWSLAKQVFSKPTDLHKTDVFHFFQERHLPREELQNLYSREDVIQRIQPLIFLYWLVLLEINTYVNLGGCSFNVFSSHLRCVFFTIAALAITATATAYGYSTILLFEAPTGTDSHYLIPRNAVAEQYGQTDGNDYNKEPGEARRS